MEQAVNFERFREELRDALAGLYDPDYLPSELLVRVVGCEPGAGGGPTQSAIVQVIEELEPKLSTPRGAELRLVYDTLHHRFVLGMTQEETAYQMRMSVRHLRRVQREATHFLARLIWEQAIAREASGESTERSDETDDDNNSGLGPAALDWRAQVGEELASLQRSAPEAVADVTETIQAVVELERVLTARYGVTLRTGSLEQGLSALVHPSAFRQVLVMALGQFVRCLPLAVITVDAYAEARSAVISLRASCEIAEPVPDVSFLEELLTSLGGSAAVSVDDDGLCLRVAIPCSGEVGVLIVDDNDDLVHFYRRCVAGTRYRLSHVAEGRQVLDLVGRTPPDIVVLDVMLPDMDGWELLSQLHEHPATREIPIVVCSVINEPELALALGAAVYLPKPVDPDTFVGALNRARAWTASAETATQANTPAAG
jgi:CheY-like chemotaxis protein